MNGTTRRTMLLVAGAALILAAAAARAADAPAESPATKQSMENVKKLLLAANLYANEHTDQWPAKLADLVDPDGIEDKSVLVDPADPKKRPWVYHPWTPAQQKKLDIATTPVIWSPNDDAKAKRTVGFLDGHVELVMGKEKLDALVKRADEKATQ